MRGDGFSDAVEEADLVVSVNFDDGTVESDFVVDVDGS